MARGCPAGLQIQAFDQTENLEQVRSALTALASESHDRKTVVIDSADVLEIEIHRQACKDHRWESVETPGYGRGYVEIDKYWLDILAALDYLRRQRGMIVVVLAHSAIETVSDPRAPAYSSYTLRLHKRARALIQDRADLIGFLAQDVHVTSEEQGFNKKRNRADGGSTRWLHVEARPAFTAKNRFNMPAKLQISKNLSYGEVFSPYFPAPQGK
jgi:hypothetical protein